MERWGLLGEGQSSWAGSPLDEKGCQALGGSYEGLGGSRLMGWPFQITGLSKY